MDETKDKSSIVNWQSQSIPEDLDTIYIKEYSSKTIQMSVSLFSASGSGKNVDSTLERFGAMSLKLSNFTDAPLKLNSLEIENIYGPSNQVSS